VSLLGSNRFEALSKKKLCLHLQITRDPLLINEKYVVERLVA
jgi:hypothetical protein